MANIKSFPNNQDVYIGSEDVMKWLHGRTSGVFAAEGNASVSALADSTMAVTVSDGLGWMANAGKDGIVWWIDNEAVTGSKLQLSIDPADGVLNRIDRIIVEWQTTNYVDYPEVKVLKGTTSSRATAPALTNSSTVRQISLASIDIVAGTTAITASMIADERLNRSVCGIVTESVTADTSVINAQFEELLERVKRNLQQITDEQILDGSITVPKLAEETINYIDRKAIFQNLLDNSDFTNPVNQRGITSRTGLGYTIDRWTTQSSYTTVTVNDDCLSIKCTNSDKGAYLTQFIEPGKIKSSKPYTLSVQLKDGSVHAMSFVASVGMTTARKEINFGSGQTAEIYFEYNSNASLYCVVIRSYSGSNLDVANVALYEGKFNNENLPNYYPKGYSAEYVECRRYYKVIANAESDGIPFGFGNVNASAAKQIIIGIPWDGKMRISPSIIKTGTIRCFSNVASAYEISTIAMASYSDSVASVIVTMAATLDSGKVYIARAEAGSTLAFSADL